MGTSATASRLVPPLFVGGCGRTGTTLLTDLLGCHHELSPIYEPWFLYDMALAIFAADQAPVEWRLKKITEEANAWIKHLKSLPHDKKEYERYRHGYFHILFTPETVRRETEILCGRLLKEPALRPFRDYILALFSEHARLDKKLHWVSKVPRYVLITPLLKQAFPTMRFIHCVRDPRATIASMSSRVWAPKSVEKQIEYWRTRVEKGAEFVRRFPSNGIEIRYEDLTSDPASTLSRVFNWSGLSDEAATIVDGYQTEFPISHGQQQIAYETSNADLDLIEQQLGDLMHRYGYIR